MIGDAIRDADIRQKNVYLPFFDELCVGFWGGIFSATKGSWHSSIAYSKRLPVRLRVQHVNMTRLD